jgi:hypothetical protein
MSIKIFSTIALLGLLFGYFGMQTWQRSGSLNQSSEISKAKIWGAEKYGKTSQAIHVVISTVSGVPDSDEQELRLKAEVSLNQKIDGDLEFEWMLPEGVTVVAGEMKDVLTNLQPGQVATLEITLMNISKEGLAKTVTLNVAGNQGNIRYGGSGSFATNSFVQMSAALAKERDRSLEEPAAEAIVAPNIKQ